MLSVPWMSSQSCYGVARAGYTYNLLLGNFPVRTSPKTIIFELKVSETSFDYPTSKDPISGLTASASFFYFLQVFVATHPQLHLNTFQCILCKMVNIWYVFFFSPAPWEGKCEP